MKIKYDGPDTIFLLNVEKLQKVNHSTIFKLFYKAMNIFRPDGVKHDDMMLFLSNVGLALIRSKLLLKNIQITNIFHTFQLF